MSKIIMAKEIIEAMQFLGIEISMFAELRKQHGSIENLYRHFETILAN